MTYDELLAKIDEEISYAKIQEACGDGGWYAGAIALRAVVKVHSPVGLDGKRVCEACSIEFWTSPVHSNLHLVDYPCPTIQAIEKELG